VLLRQIMSEARHLTEAERCSLFLVDEKNAQLVAKVFDGFSPDEQDGGGGQEEEEEEVRMSRWNNGTGLQLI
jgi:GAF domain-containing protein